MTWRNAQFIWVLAIGLVLLWLFYIFGAGSDMTGEAIRDMSGYVDVSAAEARALIDSTPELVVIDVSPFYDNGHLPGSVSYYVGDGSLDAAIPSLDMDGVYLVYCHNDVASRSGARKLVEAGFENVYRLRGNYAAWVDSGYAVEVIAE